MMPRRLSFALHEMLTDGMRNANFLDGGERRGYKKIVLRAHLMVQRCAIAKHQGQGH